MEALDLLGYIFQAKISGSLYWAVSEFGSILDVLHFSKYGYAVDPLKYLFNK